MIVPAPLSSFSSHSILCSFILLLLSLVVLCFVMYILTLVLAPALLPVSSLASDYLCLAARPVQLQIRLQVSSLWFLEPLPDLQYCHSICCCLISSVLQPNITRVWSQHHPYLSTPVAWMWLSSCLNFFPVPSLLLSINIIPWLILHLGSLSSRLPWQILDTICIVKCAIQRMWIVFFMCLCGGRGSVCVCVMWSVMTSLRQTQVQQRQSVLLTQ